MLSVASNAVQQLYSIQLTNQNSANVGVPSYLPGGHTANVVMAGSITPATGNATWDIGNSVLTLGNATSYLVTADVQFTPNTIQYQLPATFYLVNANTNTVVNSTTTPVGTPFTTTINNSGNANVYLKLQVAQSGEKKQFEYPSAIGQATLTVVQTN